MSGGPEMQVIAREFVGGKLGHALVVFDPRTDLCLDELTHGVTEHELLS